MVILKVTITCTKHSHKTIAYSLEYIIYLKKKGLATIAYTDFQTVTSGHTYCSSLHMKRTSFLIKNMKIILSKKSLNSCLFILFKYMYIEINFWFVAKHFTQNFFPTNLNIIHVNYNLYNMQCLAKGNRIMVSDHRHLD